MNSASPALLGPDPDLVKVYVGYAWTGAPKSFTDAADVFKQDVRRADLACEVFDFLTCEATGGGCSDDAALDWCLRECVPKCDLMIAIADERSTTLGAEVTLALMLGRPVLAMARKESQVSRVFVRFARIWPHFRFAQYESLRTDGLKLARDRIAEFRASHAPTLWSGEARKVA